MNKQSVYQPQSVDVKSEGLMMVWSTGPSRFYSAQLLRQACPCAKCVSEITGEVMLNRAQVPSSIHLTSANPVGNYGVTFGFSDHHATGIYAYDYLYALPESFAERVSDSGVAQVNEPQDHHCGCGHNGCHSESE